MTMLDTPSGQGAPDMTRLQQHFGQLCARHRYHLLEAAQFDPFIAAAGDRAVLFAEDPVRAPETWDLAVVLPEILALARRPLQVGLMMPMAARSHASAWSVHTWPALLFQRDGGYLGLIEGMRDWAGFAQEIAAIQARAPGRRPGVGIAVHAAPGGAGCC